MTDSESGIASPQRLNDTLAGFFQEYGLAFVMVASYFGSGSIFIASEAGVRFGYALIWAVIGAVLLGFMAQDMSARLGIFGKPLMVFLREKLGQKGALVIAVVLSTGCIAWGLELTAAVGLGVSVLLNGAIGWMPLAVVTGIMAIIVGVLNYDGIERIMTVMMFGLLALYLIVAGASTPSISAVATGVIPQIPGGSLTLVVSILGTTALWPNFFLESNLVSDKGWKTIEDIQEMRRDLVIGYTVGGLTTVAVLVVGAAVLRPAGYTELESFITPGIALAGVLGEWARVMFLLGAIAAAFNSIIPILWTPSYLLQHAWGREANPAGREFKTIFAITTGVCCFSPLVTIFGGLSVLDMIVLFPGYNGIIGLPITALALFWAVNDEHIMGEHRNSYALSALNLVLVIIAFVLAAASLPGFIDAITAGF